MSQSIELQSQYCSRQKKEFKKPCNTYILSDLEKIEPKALIIGEETAMAKAINNVSDGANNNYGDGPNGFNGLLQRHQRDILQTVQMDRTHCIDHEFEINNKPLMEMGPIKQWMELCEEIRKFMNIHEIREHALQVGIIGHIEVLHFPPHRDPGTLLKESELHIKLNGNSIEKMGGIVGLSIDFWYKMGYHSAANTGGKLRGAKEVVERYNDYDFASGGSIAIDTDYKRRLFRKRVKQKLLNKMHDLSLKAMQMKQRARRDARRTEMKVDDGDSIRHNDLNNDRNAYRDQVLSSMFE